MPVSFVATRFRLRTIGAIEEVNVPTRDELQGLIYNAPKKHRTNSNIAFLTDNEYILARQRKVRLLRLVLPPPLQRFEAPQMCLRLLVRPLDNEG